MKRSIEHYCETSLLLLLITTVTTTISINWFITDHSAIMTQEHNANGKLLLLSVLLQLSIIVGPLLILFFP